MEESMPAHAGHSHKPTPIPWTSKWPKKQGIYLFYGYPNHIEVDGFPRLLLVTVEYNSPNFGTIYRTARMTITQATGAWGMWRPVDVPNLPDLKPLEEKAKKAGRKLRRLRPLEFID
jgi:hypothetical protein